MAECISRESKDLIIDALQRMNKMDQELINTMVGSLYPDIVRSTIAKRNYAMRIIDNFDTCPEL
jgi:hypothetical protein